MVMESYGTIIFRETIMSKRFWIILGLLAVILLGFLLFRGGNEANAPENGQSKGSQHIIGNQDSDVTLVEYGDFQCPACAQYWPAFTQIKEKYADRVTFQFINLPLPTHQNARAAARAAEAAAMQDKFWEMHDLLYQNQPAWSDLSNSSALFEQYAQQLELDVEKFKEDFSSSEVNNIINADIEAFEATGEQMSTPTFFLNGEKITPQPSVESFSELIDEALSKNQDNDQ